MRFHSYFRKIPKKFKLMKQQNLPKRHSTSEKMSKSIDLDPDSSSSSAKPKSKPYSIFQIKHTPFQENPESLKIISSKGELDPSSIRENPNEGTFPTSKKVAGTIKPSITNPHEYININRIQKTEFLDNENHAQAIFQSNQNLPTKAKIQSSDFHRSPTYQAPISPFQNSPQTPSIADPREGTGMGI
jgi:hypothetical protein